MRPWSLAGWLVALAALAFLLFETRRLAAIAGEQELAARAAAAELARRDALAAPPPAPAPPADAGDFARTALELAATQQKLAAVTALLEDRNRQEAERRAAAAAEAERANRPMAAGVRECLIALHECLRAEGYLGPRFLRAEAVGQDGLTHVEMLDAEAAGIDVVFVRAARMTATIDRAQGRLVLTFFQGERALRGVSTPLPERGLELAFADVDGRVFEARLPYLVRGEGEYPSAAAAAPGRPPNELDPLLRRQWLERLDRVLADGGPTPSWRVSRVRGLADGWFLGADLVATDDKRHVVASASCERFAVELDEATGIVSLRLRDGALRRNGVDSSISGEGLRVLLPNLSCKQASDGMLGMVVRR